MITAGRVGEVLREGRLLLFGAGGGQSVRRARKEAGVSVGAGEEW